ncbi:MAG TPA: cation:proton antiporter, partial [Trichocoleus sp.]
GVGAASGVLTESLDAAIIVMVILTTFLAPPLLRVVFRNQPDEEGASPAIESTAAAAIGPEES